MTEYGLLGEKLGHSFSREIHSMIGDYNYRLIEIKSAQLADFLERKDFKAVNVTIPYKQKVIPFMDDMTCQAAEIGAVNCIRNQEGRLIGHNTDFDGLKALIRHCRINAEGKKVLILGTGGTSDTAMAVCKSLKAAEIIKVSRHKYEKAATYEEAHMLHKDAQIIINTTPCGMYPEVYNKPVTLSSFKKLEGVIDVIYNPLRSSLVTEASERGIRAEGGLYMLVAQAVAASEFFMNKSYSPQLTEDIYKDILRDKTNLVLIGMPGSGKSTIGKKLGSLLGREFFDEDRLIEEKAGMSISEIFKRYGENYFRDMETEVLSELAVKNGAVIATGGGCVTREQNIRLLKMNGRIVFTDREPELLVPTCDRPTAFDTEHIMKRYEERFDLYCSAADITVKNNGPLEKTVEDILEEF